MVEANCPECNEELEVLDDVLVGEILDCQNCGIELEVISRNGDDITLAELGITGEGWGE